MSAQFIDKLTVCMRTGFSLLVPLLVACDSEKPIGPLPEGPALPPLVSAPELTTVDSSVLTGDALAAWQPDGRFVVRGIPVDTFFRRMTVAQAETAWSRMFYPSASFRERRGAELTGPLRPCGPRLYAETALMPLPPSTSIETQIALGPFWQLQLCDADTVVAISAIGAYGAELPWIGLNIAWNDRWFDLLNAGSAALVIPRGVRYPRHPEEAAARVAAFTGRRVRTVPRLVRMRPPYAGTLALWYVELDAPVSVRGVETGETRLRSALFYGIWGPRWELGVWDGVGDVTGPFPQLIGVKMPNGQLKDTTVMVATRGVPSLYRAERVTR